MIYLKPNQTNTIVVTWSQRETQTPAFVTWQIWNDLCTADGAFAAESGQCLQERFEKFFYSDFRWILTHIETLQELVVTVAKSANLSPARERYDKFLITAPFTRPGQYKYIVYEANGSNVVAVVDSGLAQVEMAEQGYAATNNAITYKSVDEANGVFDFTFDSTFN